MAAPRVHSDVSASSFVVEVLKSSGKLEKNDINDQVGGLIRKIDDVKVEVYEALHKKYVDFYPNFKTAVDLKDRVDGIKEQMDNTVHKLETDIKDQLNEPVTEFQDLSQQLNEYTMILCILDKLVAVDGLRQEAQIAINADNFTLSARKFEQINDLLQQQVLSNNRDEELSLFTSIRNASHQDRTNLINDLDEMWRECVHWSLPKKDGKAQNCVLTLKTVGKDSTAKIRTAVQAMHDLQVLVPKLQLFADRLLNYIIKPLLEKPSAVISVNVKQNAELALTLKKNSDESTDQAMQVLGNIVHIVKFLDKHLFCAPIEESAAAVKSKKGQKTEKKTLMEYLGDIVSENLIECIIELCLAKTIPTSKKELEEYKIVEQTGILETALIDARILPAGSTALTDYIGNINVLSATKKTQKILEMGRSLMTAHLQNTVFVSDTAPFGEVHLLRTADSLKNKSADTGSAVKKSKLSASTFKMPACHISLSVQNLITLAYEILDEAVESATPYSVQLFYAVRNLFELFCHVTPTYHRENLQNIPHVSAIYHNNCMYVAHYLLTFGHQYRAKLPEPLCQGSATFIDVVQKVRRLGTETFLQQMTRQKQLLLEYLESANKFVSISEDGNFVAAERSIKQVLFQLTLLSRVWRDCLPLTVYNKAMGTLINSVFVEVFSSVSSLEDISADDATQLYTLLSKLAEESALVLQTSVTNEDDSTESEEHVIELPTQHISKWQKFQELLMVLNAGLQEISDRWAEGKGPLARELSANEMKQLIRALFQNTDRRAAVISKIH